MPVLFFRGCRHRFYIVLRRLINSAHFQSVELSELTMDIGTGRGCTGHRVVVCGQERTVKIEIEQNTQLILGITIRIAVKIGIYCALWIHRALCREN